MLRSVFIKRFGDKDFVILLLYIDDMVIIGRDTINITNLKKTMNKFLTIKDLVPIKQILGVTISRDRKKRKI